MKRATAPPWLRLTVENADGSAAYLFDGRPSGATVDIAFGIKGIRLCFHTDSSELWAKVGDGIGGKAAYRGGA